MLAESLFLFSLLGSFAGPRGFESFPVEQSAIAYSPGETENAVFSNVHPFYRGRDVSLTLHLSAGQAIGGFETDGCQVIDVSPIGESVIISVFLASEECSLATRVVDNSGSISLPAAYFFKAGGGWYASCLSLASAKVAYYDDAFENGTIGEAEHSRLVSSARLLVEDTTPSLGPIIPPPPVSLYDYFYPSLSWTDGDGNEQPLAYVTVELYKIVDGAKTKLSSAVTDENGEATLKTLSVSAADADSFSVDVLAYNEQVQVSQGDEESHDLYIFSIDNVVRNRVFSLKLASDSEANHFFQLFEIGAYCSLFGQSIAGNRTLHQLTIAYSDSFGNPYFLVTDDQSRIIKVDPYHSGGSSSICTYEDWDTVAHEYGHFLSSELGWAHLGEWAMDHSDDLNMIDEFAHSQYSNTPEEGLEFAWTEGLATYLGQAALRHNSEALATVPLANDRAYTTANGYSYNFDDYGYTHGEFTVIPKGAGNEYAISQLLYNMADSRVDLYDGLGLGDAAVISMLDHIGASKTAGSFVNHALDVLDDDDSFALGKLLERLDFSPKNLAVSFAFGRPRFSWEGTGGSTTHPFVSFYLTVYNEELMPIYAISSHDSYSWNPSSSTWDTIVGDAGGGAVYLKVAGRTELEYVHFPSSLLEVSTQ